MKFGTNIFYNYIKNNIASTDFEAYYDYIASVVEDDTKIIFNRKGFRVSSNITKEDIEDTLQEIQISVKQALPVFIVESGDKSEQQRNAWFSTIVDRRIKDFFRKYYRRMEREVLQLSDENEGILQHDAPSLEESFIALYDTDATANLLNALRYICSIDTSPEKIIAFLFNKFICALHDTKKSNGSPVEVASQLNGKTVRYAAEAIKQKIQNTIKRKLPDDVFAALDEKLNLETDGVKNADCIFNLSPRTITDSTYWITSKLKKDKDRILDENVGTLDKEGLCK